MNDFLVDGIYKNTQKVRVRNRVEEKLLKEIIDGHKGYREKLNKSLCKIEKTRQIIEQEFYYMTKEMRELGINPMSKNKYQKNTNLSTTDQTSMKLENQTDVFIKNDYDSSLNFEKLKSSPKITKPCLIQRRSSIGGLKTSESDLVINNLRRKFSLDSSKFFINNNSTYLSKLNECELEENRPYSNKSDLIQETNINNMNDSQIETRSIYSALFTPTKTESDMTAFYFQKPSTNQSARTYLSTKSGLSNPSTQTFNSIRRESLLKNSSIHFPNIRNRRKSSASSTKSKQDDSKRQVSFGQVELNQLDIPIMYKHSNIGLEKFKLNPYFYLPNGDLKRKFSLPKLDETLEAVKNCRYLRKISIESDDDLIDVKNIFQDNDNNSSQNDLDILTNY